MICREKLGYLQFILPSCTTFFFNSTAMAIDLVILPESIFFFFNSKYANKRKTRQKVIVFRTVVSNLVFHQSSPLWTSSSSCFALIHHTKLDSPSFKRQTPDWRVPKDVWCVDHFTQSRVIADPIILAMQASIGRLSPRRQERFASARRFSVGVISPACAQWYTFL